MATLFALSQHWKSYDVFSVQKTSTFRSSRPAVLELASRYNDLTKQISSQSKTSSQPTAEQTEAEKVLFTEMCEICLWGNATDLSLLTNLSYDDIQKLQGSAARKAQEKNIIANDFSAAFATLHAAKASGKTDRRVDIVLDNAGFELYVDLLLAGYLLQSGLATTIVLHPKNIPWFVSDVVPRDFAALFSVLLNAKNFYETPTEDDKNRNVTPAALSKEEEEAVAALAQNWSELYAEGKIVLRPNAFWTEGGSFWRLPSSAPALFEDLKESELVIFKGDLNYRKLVGDVSVSCAGSRREMLMLYRPCGTLLHRLSMRLDRSVLARECVLLRSGLARRMLLWACQRVRMRDSELWREVVETAVRESGLGVVSGLSFNFAMARLRDCKRNTSVNDRVHHIDKIQASGISHENTPKSAG